MRTEKLAASQMSAAKRELVRADLKIGQDETNPHFLFSTTHTTLLLGIVGNLIDPNFAARLELGNRGRDANGEWCGANRARAALLGHLSNAAGAVTNGIALAAATDIARCHLEIDTLETRNSDALDFHDLAVWSIREALVAAFNAGRTAGGS